MKSWTLEISMKSWTLELSMKSWTLEISMKSWTLKISTKQCFSLEREVPESVAWGKGRIQVYFTFLVYLWFSKRIMSSGLFQGGVLTIPDNLNSWSFSARTTKMLKSLNIAVIPKSGTPNVNQTFVKFNDQTVKILKINISNSLKMSTCWNF